MKPSVLIYDGICSFLVLVISQHDILSLCNNLTRNSLWVFTGYLHIHKFHGLSTTSWNEIMPVYISNQWGSFCGSIDHSDRKSDIDKEIFYLFIQPSTSYSNLIHCTTKLSLYDIENALFNFFIDNRHCHQ